MDWQTLNIEKIRSDNNQIKSDPNLRIFLFIDRNLCEGFQQGLEA